ncbi:TIGR04168 family protein [Gloeocapsopsis dulcis]|uniref:TIGR04168 family protein n=1 Tax=Gloeocapsopsis dulcis AAB1 = 1H9 TaxID=1433147 RepID=A0A6N8G312_9CHRO|nr:TIGR04168 family protein [Gloeocapsopsis dulcis]MUL39324.1 TIGR04168 family protein [Gloeocapsopsis dulcis AAB1 = 1H9]WNN91570.1 TIGR04168 family protein [Gloeocapsopsis dulcis]
MTSQTYEHMLKIAVIGDIHDQWEAEDGIALRHLGVDLVLFVGDFGNESVEVVRAIASLDIPKAAVFGNHDAWYTATDWGRKKCPYNREQEDWVQQQIDLLGESHVGYQKRDFPEFNLSVIGSRPFSWGGTTWKNASFYKERFGVTSFAESTTLMVAAAESAQHDNIIFLGHNGPFGLGNRAEDPCGKDWQPLGGDFGDPDFTEAIAQTRAAGKNIPLVTFGHMHHKLRHTQQMRKAIAVAEGTVYLNAASVPRIVQIGDDRQRNFSLVYLQGTTVTQVSLVWINQNYKIASEQVLYQKNSSLMQPV